MANDVSDNVFYINLGDGTFNEVSHLAHVADYRGAMGIGVGDWDNNGSMDLFVTHWLAEQNGIYINKFDKKSTTNSRLDSRMKRIILGWADFFGLCWMGHLFF